MSIDSSSAFQVDALAWPEFTRTFAKLWKPGEHVAMIGPTGVGKTTLAAQLLPLRKYVLALDPKGGDPTLRALEKRGFERVGTWPLPPRIRRDIDKGKPARLIVGPRVQKYDELTKVRAVIERALPGAWNDGGWTIYSDELQLMTDRRMMGLAATLEQFLIAARSRSISVVTSFQRPANVPRAASDQAAWLVIWRTRDVDVQARLAEMMGRPRHELRGAMRALEAHCVLIASRDPYRPILATKAPKL